MSSATFLLIISIASCSALATPKNTDPGHNGEFRVNLLEYLENTGTRLRHTRGLHTRAPHNFSFPWPVKKIARIDGDATLGGLMMVHEREDTIICGPIMPQGGIQALETMLYTIDYVNSIPDFIPGVTIGAYILDDCDKDTYGLEQAVDFVKGSISNIDEGESSCRNASNHEVISGVVGAPSSVTSIQVAHLLRLFKIPQVSFFSTSPELSNKQRFEYFSRTIPSDQNQVRVMVEIIMKLKWTYISILYEESNYGIKGFEELETLLSANSICIAVKEKLAKDSGTADKATYDHIVDSLLSKPTARGVVIFASDQEVAGVMRAVHRRNATERFTWIGSDGWSARSLVSTGNERAVEGTLSVQPRANQVSGFKEYFLNLTVENNKRNPWFVEFWEHSFDCRWPGSLPTPHNVHKTKKCTGKEKMTNTEVEGQLQFVSDAVLAFAYAIRDMHRDVCGGSRGLCHKMVPIEGQVFLRYLRNVSFTGLSGDQFQFDENGDGPARYAILHYKQVHPGHWEWVEVGLYEDHVLRLNMSAIQYKFDKLDIPESVCSKPCQKGEKKTYVEGEICCWHCINCTQFEILHPKDETQCYECLLGELPNNDKTVCVQLPEEYLQPMQPMAIGAMTFALAGVFVTGFIIAVYIKHHDTPVVRASSRELSYVLLSGIFMCYGLTFILILRPTHVVCGIQQFVTGFSFTIMYSALFTKTNRIARIFQAGKKSAKRPSFISPRSQLLICAALCVVQIIIMVIWMLVQPPHARYYYPTRYSNLFVCEAFIEFDYMIAFAYPISLIVVCTIYAVLTRKIPEDYNESKYIGFAMYTTCIIWLAFVTIYFVTGNHIELRIVTTCVSVSLSATVSLVCLFTPKLYIILLHPEKNVRQSMMKQHQYSAVKGGVGKCIRPAGVAVGTQCDPLPPPAYTEDASVTLNSEKTATSANREGNGCWGNAVSENSVVCIHCGRKQSIDAEPTKEAENKLQCNSTTPCSGEHPAAT